MRSRIWTLVLQDISSQIYLGPFSCVLSQARVLMLLTHSTWLQNMLVILLNKCYFFMWYLCTTIIHLKTYGLLNSCDNTEPRKELIILFSKTKAETGGMWSLFTWKQQVESLFQNTLSSFLLQALRCLGFVCSRVIC